MFGFDRTYVTKLDKDLTKVGFHAKNVKLSHVQHQLSCVIFLANVLSSKPSPTRHQQIAQGRKKRANIGQYSGCNGVKGFWCQNGFCLCKKKEKVFKVNYYSALLVSVAVTQEEAVLLFFF